MLNSPSEKLIILKNTSIQHVSSMIL